MKLFAVTNDTYDVHTLASYIQAIEPFVDFIILREKSKTIQQWFTLFSLLERDGIPKEKCIVHDRLDVAHIMKFPSVQLPGYSVPVHLAKRAYPSIRIGRSVHSYEEALEAEREGADYLLYGHVYTTPSKKGLPPRGTDELRRIVQCVDIPVVAIGGIRLEQIDEMRQIQVDGIAVLSPFFQTSTPREVAQQFHHRLMNGTTTDV